MRHLTVEKIVFLHGKIILQSGGSHGLRDRGALESAVAQPEMSFQGADLYRTVPEKTAALGYSLIRNHAFVDGNKRIGHAAMEVLLVLNGYEIGAPVDKQERIIMALASGRMDRDNFARWVQENVREFGR